MKVLPHVRLHIVLTLPPAWTLWCSFHIAYACWCPCCVIEQQVTADTCAQYEALWAGLNWCDTLGINRGALGAIYSDRDRNKIHDPGVRLRCALDHLPLDAVGRQAAVLIELAAEVRAWRHALSQAAAGSNLHTSASNNTTQYHTYGHR
jgi:hypothetical protein